MQQNVFCLKVHGFVSEAHVNTRSKEWGIRYAASGLNVITSVLASFLCKPYRIEAIREVFLRRGWKKIPSEYKVNSCTSVSDSK